MHVKHRLWLVGLVFVSLPAFSQLLTDLDPDWKESETPPPPTFNKDKLVAVDMPRHVTLKFGVDPSTLKITPDGIVRYVMVATNSTGSVNAFYEGIRCQTGEVKTYARYNASGQWSPVQVPEWAPLNGNQGSRHALALARQGACHDRSTAASDVQEIVTRLKDPRPMEGRGPLSTVY
jgi:hypothetical protein